MNLEERIERIEKENKLIVDSQSWIVEAIERLKLTQAAQYKLGDFESKSIDILFDLLDQNKVREQKERNSKAPVMKEKESMEEFLLRTSQDRHAS